MIKAKLEGDKLPIPKNIIQKAGLKDGDEVEVRLEGGKVVIKPITTKPQFMKELKGCFRGSKIDPLEVKRIWKARSSWTPTSGATYLMSAGYT